MNFVCALPRHRMAIAHLLNFPAVILFLASVANLYGDALSYATTQTGPGQFPFGLLDLNTGGFSKIAALTNFVNDLSVSPNGTLYGIIQGPGPTFTHEFATINPSTGAITNIAPDSAHLNSIAFSSNGTLYGTGFVSFGGPETLYTINPLTGAESLVADLSGTIATTAQQLRFVGNTAYTTSFTTPSGLYTVDLTSGAGTLVGNTPLNQINGLGALVNGKLVDTAGPNNNAQLFWIDPATGATTAGANVSNNYAFTSVTPGPTPILETDNYARFYPATDPNVSYACSNTNGVACTGSALAPGTNWTVHYNSQGTSGFGVLHDQASVSLTGDNSLGAFASSETTAARSGYQDTYTILGGSGSGTLDLTFHVTGTTSSSGGGFTNNLFEYVPVVNGVEQPGSAVDYNVVGGNATIPVSFTFNQPSTFAIYFDAIAGISSWQSGSSASADFSDTAILDQIVVLNSLNQAVSNFTVSTTSGTTYGSNGVVPEPATVGMIAGSLFLLWSKRARKSLRGKTFV